MIRLSEEQTRFINAAGANVGCVAGPGSGKTATIIERARRFARAGQKVWIITYTNAAANEINERVQSEQGEPITASTIHRFCLKWLKADLEVIDSAIVYSTLVDLLKGNLNGRWTRGQIRDARFELHRSHYGGTRPAEPLAALWDRIEAFLVSQGMIDQDGILLKYDATPRAEIDALFLDEAQDANALVWRCFRKTVKLDGSPMFKSAVGDPDQSIFGFIGDGLHEFGEYLRSADEVTNLVDNYRSDRQIVQACNALLGDEKLTPESVAISDKEGAADVHPSETAEAETAELIKWIKNGPQVAADHAVLCRTNKIRQAVSEALRSAGVPVAGDEIDAPKGWWSFKMFLEAMNDRSNKIKTLNYIVGLDCYSLAEISAMMVRSKRTRINLLDLIVSPDLTLCSAYGEMMRLAGYSEPDRLIMKIMTECTNHAEIALFDAKQAEKEFENKGDPDGVTVTTIHKAKGRQWPYVWIPAIDARWSTLGSKVDRDEERRILYVGMTRAMNNLTVSFAGRAEVIGILAPSINVVDPGSGVVDPGDRQHAFRND